MASVWGNKEPGVLACEGCQEYSSLLLERLKTYFGRLEHYIERPGKTLEYLKWLWKTWKCLEILRKTLERQVVCTSDTNAVYFQLVQKCSTNISLFSFLPNPLNFPQWGLPYIFLDLFWTDCCWMPRCPVTVCFGSIPHCTALIYRCTVLHTGLLYGCTVALLLYGWTPTKCGTGVAAAALEKSGGCGRSSVVVHLQLDFSAWQCAPAERQRGCHQVGVRRLSRAARLQSPSASRTRRNAGKWPPECFLSWIFGEVTAEVGEEEDDGVAEARGRGDNYAHAHGEISNFYRLQRQSVINI